jgi:hypothetical protein
MVGRIMAPRYVHILIPRTYKYIVFMEKGTWQVWLNWDLEDILDYWLGPI